MSTDCDLEKNEKTYKWQNNDTILKPREYRIEKTSFDTSNNSKQIMSNVDFALSNKGSFVALSTIRLPQEFEGDSYFREKELHLNTMLRYLGLPSLFITLSMAETKWEHLKELLINTDNHDTLPSNRPFHVTCHFINRFRSMKKNIWKDSKVSGWGTIETFFERVEFQNRGAALSDQNTKSS
ncbi:1324_t:CDS:2 [Gigaspora rosea]|nr:1324_t:CDS:2 [Gigaspora rosea]